MDDFFRELNTHLTLIEKGESAIDSMRAVMSKGEDIVRRKLNYELPYNEWLYDLLIGKLTPLPQQKQGYIMVS